MIRVGSICYGVTIDPRFVYIPAKRRRSPVPKVLVAVLALAIAAVGAVAAIKAYEANKVTVDPASVGTVIEQEIRNATTISINVTCPSGIPMETGRIFDCIAAPLVPDGSSEDLRVTEDDAHGHFHWQPTLQYTVGGQQLSGGSN